MEPHGGRPWRPPTPAWPRAALCLLLITLAGSCTHREGGDCGMDYLYSPAPFCEGNLLWVCSGTGHRTGAGVWTRTACKGPQGCRKTERDGIACDISGNTAGDRCAYNHTWNNRLQACSALDPSVMLDCAGNHALEQRPCPGGCVQINHHEARCSAVPASLP